MMSRKSLVLLTAVLLLMPAAAFANGGWMIDARGGVGLPMGDFGNSFKSGMLIGVEASKMMSTNLAIGVDGNYMKNNGDEAIFGTGTDVSAKFMHYGVHGKYMLGSAGSKMMPYMVAGAGLYNSKLDNAGPSTSSTDFGLRAGLGMNLMMGPKWGLGFQADYNDVMTEGSSSQFVGISGGLHFMLTPSSSQ
jgi:outer membrane protein W